MYLHYGSFVDCLIKSGYKKTHSCLTHETWMNGCVFEVNSFEVED